ncbi:sulfotransferase family protein [Frateuria hangzhouensis]|uniref:sulfotransferase family protein n=1 Tax=Frateuria hangzhouensis TaxID=2995589 RepID=UPI002260AAD0|nr:sulfotransferase [Frateuria sp. STR12]MCX7513942.1 sulfotransferase [Frateuria sp. STR12]
MNDTPIEHALVVGCPRSGTTLLQSTLAAHPDVFSTPETHFFADAIGQRAERLFALPPSGWRERQRRRLRQWRAQLGLIHPRGARRRLCSFLRHGGGEDLLFRVPPMPLFLAPLARLYAELGDELARRDGRRLWLEKTPGHLHYLDAIEQYLPDIKVICVVRSAPDNIASMYDVATRYPDRWRREYRTVEGCVGRWIASARAAEAQAHRGGRMFLAYEELAANPAGTLERVCAFLGLTFEPAMIEQRGATYDRIVGDHEPHKQNVRETIGSRNGTKFSRLFTPSQQAHIVAALGDWPGRMEALCRGHLHTVSNGAHPAIPAVRA